MMKIRKIWESKISLILPLWIVIAAIIRPGWFVSGAGILFWIALLYFTAPGVFWNYSALFIPNPAIAEKMLLKSVSFGPLIASPYLILGLNYAHSQKWQEAIPLLEKAVEYAPEGQKSRNLLRLGEVYRASGMNDKALTIFEELQKRGLQSMNLFLDLALANLQLNRFAEALEYAEKARTFNLSATTPVLVQGKAHFLMGQFQQAKSDYQWAIEHMKWPVESFYWLGRAELELGDTEAAIGHLQTAVERITADPLLADVSKEEAEEWLGRALKNKQSQRE